MGVDEKKKSSNLFRSLQNDTKNVFYLTNKITKSLSKKAKMGVYNKDNVFVKLYEHLPLVTPYIDKKTNIDYSRFSSISRPF